MGHYDVMQVCRNGHQITDMAREAPQGREDYCTKCGQETILQCDHCNTPIRGHYLDGPVFLVSSSPVPDYCHRCGKAYPWRESALENVREILKLQLSEEDYAAAESVLSDVARDTPKSESAGMRLGLIIRKLQKPAYDMTIKVVSDVASAAARNGLGL